MIRYVVEGQQNDGTWINLFKDNRNFKSYVIASRAKNRHDDLECAMRVGEIEVESDVEKLEKYIIELKIELIEEREGNNFYANHENYLRGETFYQAIVKEDHGDLHVFDEENNISVAISGRRARQIINNRKVKL